MRTVHRKKRINKKIVRILIDYVGARIDCLNRDFDAVSIRNLQKAAKRFRALTKKQQKILSGP
jgi:hypothetical protein